MIDFLYLLFKLKMKKKGVTINSKMASHHAKYEQNSRVEHDVYIGDDVTLGRYSYVNPYASIENCKIGNFCSISENVHICPFNHNKKFVSTHPFLFNKYYGFIKENVNLKTDRGLTLIGNDVWIGLNVIVMENCSIGDGAIIAAGSVVTHDIPAFEIWGGIPARKMSDRFQNAEKEILEKSAWWNWSDNDIKNIVSKMYCIDSFIGCKNDK